MTQISLASVAITWSQRRIRIALKSYLPHQNYKLDHCCGQALVKLDDDVKCEVAEKCQAGQYGQNFDEPQKELHVDSNKHDDLFIAFSNAIKCHPSK